MNEQASLQQSRSTTSEIPRSLGFNDYFLTCLCKMRATPLGGQECWKWSWLRQIHANTVQKRCPTFPAFTMSLSVTWASIVCTDTPGFVITWLRGKKRKVVQKLRRWSVTNNAPWKSLNIHDSRTNQKDLTRHIFHYFYIVTYDMTWWTYQEHQNSWQTFC